MSSDRKEYNKIYREKNKDKINARNRECNKNEARKKYMAEFRKKNKEKQKEYEETRRLENPERYLARDRKRRLAKGIKLNVYKICQSPLCENEIKHKIIDQKYCSKKCCDKTWKIKQRELK